MAAKAAPCAPVISAFAVFRICHVGENRAAFGGGHPFWRNGGIHRADAGNITARSIEPRDKAGLYRIGADREKDRDVCCCRLGRARCREGVERDNDRHPALHKIDR